jgi:starch synthase (maltosyl-transferring)
VKRDRGRADSLKELIGRLNRIRHENVALQRDWSLRFHPTDNHQLLAYSKREGQNAVLVVVNLDFNHPQSGFVDVDLDGSFEVQDLLSGGRYTWNRGRNYVELNPGTLPAHVFKVVR